MEEQKNNGKTVKMQAVKSNENVEEKLSYEKLNEVAQQLFNENNYLKQANAQMQETIQTINRLNYLLKIVEIGEKAFRGEFLVNCVAEIESIMTPPAENSEATEKGN